jgi:hypothetical protein
VTHQYKAKKIIYCSLFFIKIIFVITLIQISWVVPLHAKIALQPVKYKGQEIVNKKFDKILFTTIVYSGCIEHYDWS